MTINEILSEAFDRIKKEHKVALSNVSFETHTVSSTGGHEDKVLTGTHISADALRGGQ